MTFRRERPVFGPLPLVFCAFILAGCRAEMVSGKDITLSSSGGYTIAATVVTPAAPNPPGIILLHMMGSNRTAWKPFQLQARADGYASIAIDLRGHGDTKSDTGERENVNTFTAADWLAVLDDVSAAKRALVESGADPDKVAVMGASIGANLALRYASSDPTIHAVVLMSPGEDYRGVTTPPVMDAYTRRPVLMMAARGDAYSASSAQKLDSLAKEFCELRLYPGTAHGTDLLAAEPVAADQVLMWLDQVLNHRPTN